MSINPEEARDYVKRAQAAAGDIPGLPEAEASWRPETAAVVGAGTMGGGIAMSLANAGIPVTLVDRADEDLQRGLKRIRANYDTSVKRGSVEQAEADARFARITPKTGLEAVAGAGLVIEAVFEEMSVKQDVFRQIDAHAEPGALLGTNTSALDIDQIAAATGRPGDVIGTHFFAPANVMKLLEVVPGQETTPATLARAMALGKALGKVAVRAGNVQGFIGNAMLADYIQQSHQLIEDGSFPADVDRVLKDFGFAMGLFTMTDMSGLDIGIESKRKARAASEASPGGPRRSFIGLLPADMGRLGQKTGAGWYKYEPGDRTPHRDPEMDAAIVEYSAKIGVTRREISDEEILNRVLYALVNRAAWLLEKGVAAKATDIDAVYATGYGFPKDKGGPLYWADSVGLASVLEGIERLRAEYGDVWEPAPLLTKLAQSGRTFTKEA